MALPTILLPDNVRPAAFDIQRHHKVLTSAPIAGMHRMQTRVIGEAYHTIKLKYDPIHRDDFGAIIPFLNSLRGQHDTFGLIIPNYTKTVTGLVEGNYVTTTGGKTRQILSAGNGPNTELFTWTTSSFSKTFSNGLSVTTGNPVGVYFDASGVPAGTTICLWTSNDGVTGSILSDSFTVTEGRNVHFLTPTSTGSCYVRIEDANLGITKTSIKSGFLKSSYTTTYSPDLTAGHSGDFIMPLPAAVMKVSLNSPAQKISYGADSLIRIDLDLIERE